MTTMRDTLTRAIRMTRARPGGDTPDAWEMAGALEVAQSIYMNLPKRILTDVLVSADYTAGENERITDTSGTATITLPTTVTGADGVARAPQNGALVEIVGASSGRHVYVSELQDWITVSALALTDAQPFGAAHDGDMAAIIAAEVAGPVLQHECPQDVLAMAGAGRRNIRQKFRQIYLPSFSRALVPPVIPIL